MGEETRFARFPPKEEGPLPVTLGEGSCAAAGECCSSGKGSLEVVVVDVVGVEDRRRAENDGAVRSNRVGTKLPCGEGFPFFTGQVAGNRVRRHVIGEIAKIAWIPQREFLNRAAL